MSMNQELLSALTNFSIPGKLTRLEPLKRGHIHDTYIGFWQIGQSEVRYVHQEINTKIFTSPDALMRNIELVTEHIRLKAEERGEDPRRATLRVVPRREGGSWLRTESGRSIRTYDYIEDSEGLLRCDSVARAKEAARACGQFDADLADLETAQIEVVIPSFHDTRFRLKQLSEAREQNLAKRVESVASELAQIDSRAAEFSRIAEMLESGELPLRISHFDIKFNNFLFDLQTKRALCLVDLDTCMPGTLLYDFGDLLRDSCSTAAEDEADLTKVSVDLTFLDAMVPSYFQAIGIPSASEIKLAPVAPQVLAYNLGVRFLTDYLNGDRYFKIARPDHNLDRARNQLKVVAAFKGVECRIEDLIEKQLS